MKILIIQHSAADFPATAGEVIERLGIPVETLRVDKHDPYPETADADALIMFGGGISLTADELPPWVAQEQQLVRRYVNEGRRVLGICLGSQMLAAALGCEVRRNREPEIGWHAIERVESAASSKLASEFPDPLTVLQWHQDTFDIPPGARRLFRSEACDNQGYAIDDRVFGFQFHLEASARTVRTFLAVSNVWKQQAPYVQSEAEINAGVEAYLPTQAETLERFLSGWLK